MLEVVQQTLMITGFVFVMMLVIEYISVLSRGRWQEKLRKYKWKQYLVAGFLGVTPGCLGAFAVVTLYSHRILSLGAVVAAMIATSGDEAFVMLASSPANALLLFAILLVVGIIAGVLTDLFYKRHITARELTHLDFEIHPEESKKLFSLKAILGQWRECSAARGVMATGLALLIFGILTGFIGHHHIIPQPPGQEAESANDDQGDSEATSQEQDDSHKHGKWNWMSITLLITALMALFIVATVPDHFLDEHLWRHIAREHLPRIFLWTLGALIALHILNTQLDFDKMVRGENWMPWILLGMACLLGLVPQSGPHFVFLFLFIAGTIPFSILLASSIVQDGHGMLPMLAHSRRAFIVVKTINLLVGALVGGAALGLGF